MNDEKTEKTYIEYNGFMDKRLPPGERRRHIRFPVCLAVKFRKESPNEYKSFILNMSEGGVFIQTDEPLPVGTKILIQLYIPPQVKVLSEFIGKVTWVNADDSRPPKGMGINFDSGNKDSLKQLKDFLEEELPLFDQEV
jgi:uncharacterized protein (TIGR02266 family)